MTNLENFASGLDRSEISLDFIFSKEEFKGYLVVYLDRDLSGL